MKWKKFLKPTIGKIILFLILMGGINAFLILNISIQDARILVGIPLGFYPIGSFYCQPNTACVPPPVEFSWVNFIIDSVVWYLISCITIWIYAKLKKKK
jgi:hypothetical protein